MTQYTPSIETRGTDDLIFISKRHTDEWQQAVIDIAKTELVKRGLNQTQIDSRYLDLEKEFQTQIESEQKEASEEDFSVFKKIWIIIFWPSEIFHNWTLRRDGFVLKSKRRLQLIGLGVIIYLILILTSI